jgi:hypothetical protein
MRRSTRFRSRYARRSKGAWRPSSGRWSRRCGITARMCRRVSNRRTVGSCSRGRPRACAGGREDARGHGAAHDHVRAVPRRTATHAARRRRRRERGVSRRPRRGRAPWSRSHHGSGRAPRASDRRQHRPRAGGHARRCRPRSGSPNQVAPQHRPRAEALPAGAPRYQRPSSVEIDSTPSPKGRTARVDRATVPQCEAPRGWRARLCGDRVTGAPCGGAGVGAAAGAAPTARPLTLLVYTADSTPLRRLHTRPSRVRAHPDDGGSRSPRARPCSSIPRRVGV